MSGFFCCCFVYIFMHQFYTIENPLIYLLSCTLFYSNSSNHFEWILWVSKVFNKSTVFVYMCVFFLNIHKTKFKETVKLFNHGKWNLSTHVPKLHDIYTLIVYRNFMKRLSNKMYNNFFYFFLLISQNETTNKFIEIDIHRFVFI